MREAFDLNQYGADAGIIPVIELVTRRMGFTFPAARMASVERSLQRIRLDAGVKDWEGFRRLLITDANVFDAVASALTVNESYFFRDQTQFELLRTSIVPRLASQPGAIRFWSAGCAAGQEPYTLAILCDQLGVADRAHIVGSDIAPRRLATARRGRFARWSMRGVSPEVIERYFTPVDMRFEIEASIRDRVEFRQMNLADPAAWATAPGSVDVLMCRNVLIYFDQPTIERVARHLIASLSERGRLLLGASDPPIADYADCRVEITSAGLVYRRAADRRVREPVPEVAPAPRRVAAEPQIAPKLVVHKPPAAPATAAPQPVPPEADVASPETETVSPSPASVIRAWADEGHVDAAIEACIEALRIQPTSVELSYLHAMLLSQAGRHGEAAAAARRTLYLDRTLVLGHVALGIAMAQLGDRAGAVRSLTTASGLLALLEDDDALPAGGGDTASRVRASVAAYLELLGGR